MSGYVLCEIVLVPRIITDPPAPGCPLLESTVTLATRPASTSCEFNTGAFFTSSALTIPTLFPTSFLRDATAVPVTTTWSSETATCESWKSAVAVWPAVTVTGFEVLP